MGGTAHRTVVARLADLISPEMTIETVAQELSNIIEPLLARSKVFVGYYLGGWEPNSHDPACVAIEAKGDKIKLTPLKLGQCHFSGMPDFFCRVFRGFAPELPEMLCKEIKSLITEEKVLKDFDKSFKTAFDKGGAPYCGRISGSSN